MTLYQEKAPSIAELSIHLDISEESIHGSYDELRSLGLAEAFYPDSNELKWFWPLSSVDHGIKVKLEGEKTVFARCAVDALGMSAMFGKSAERLVLMTISKFIYYRFINFKGGLELPPSKRG